MRKTGTLLLVTLLLASQTSKAQSYKDQQNQVLAYNVLSSGLIGGIGGAINRDDGEKWHKAFARNFGKACLGGLVKYQAKYYTHNFIDPNNSYLMIPNRLHYFLGHSMVMNASLNKKLLDTYYANLWGVDLRVSPAKKGEKRLKARLSLSTLIQLGNFMIDGHTINLHRSIEYGHITMDLDTSTIINGRKDVGGLGGYNVSVFRVNNGRVIQQIVPHEMVHTYQYYDLTPISNWYKKSTEHWYKDNKHYQKLRNYMVFDYEAIFHGISYLAMPKPTYFRNYYEFEAEHFNSRRYIQR